MICLMHAGSGLRNKLNLTSSRELIRTGCCYLLCVYCLDICQEEVFDINRPGRYPASRRTQTTYLLMSLSCGFMLTQRGGCQIGDIGNSPFSLSGIHVCSRCYSLLVTKMLEKRELVPALFFFFFFEADRMRTWTKTPQR